MMMVQYKFLFTYVCLSQIILFSLSSICHNSCSGNGRCDRWGRCTCFSGYEGNDCSKRSCPTGPQYSDIPYATDEAHQYAVCSGKGTCDYKTGACKCYSGYSGRNCGHLNCINDCSGHGRCMTLRSAAQFNDGYLFNRTTTYSRWDADAILGCACDYGWSGADCSQRFCEYGVDPRLSALPNEVVTLVCACSSSSICGGKFKLQFTGRPLNSWLFPTSTAASVVAGLMQVPGVSGNNSAHVFLPVDTFNTSLVEQTLCAKNATTKTQIWFRRNAGDLPMISLYANLISGGSVYFQTTQHLVCNCERNACNGTFRISFDGEMSGRIPTYSTGSAIVSALRAMRTIQSAGVTLVNITSTAQICQAHTVSNLSIIMHASMGNLPRLGLYSSVELSVSTHSPVSAYSTANATSAVLSLTTSDGRDDHVKLCNGIGECDFTSATCSCPFGWGLDPDIGPCGKLLVNTSTWPGLARCPGVVTLGKGTFIYPSKDLGDRQNYPTRLYVSVNPTDHRKGESVSNLTHSAIYHYTWNPTENDVALLRSTATLVANLSSNSSAGPMVLDQAKNRIFFIDANPVSQCIGVLYLPTSPSAASSQNHSTWLHLGYPVFGLAMDANYNRRKLYWTYVGKIGHADGKIYWAYMDANPPTANSLVSAIGQSYLIDPHGIAIHYLQNKIYWVDRDSTGLHSVLRSSNLDGSGYSQAFLYRKVDNHTVSANATDLVLDFSHNNTAFFIDSAHPAAIIATNLDAPIFYNNETNDDDQFGPYQTERVVTTTYAVNLTSPTYLTVDEWSQLLLFTDVASGRRTINYARYQKHRPFDMHKAGVALQLTTAVKHSTPEVFDVPVGLLIDRGLGAPQWGDYLDCYGNGRCTGLEGNFVCDCDKGFFGDCQARSCPSGKAWFHEPAVDEVAHDVVAECSNMGLCNRATGECTCNTGFEGAACERMSCPGEHSACSGRGRCMSMRHLASHNIDYSDRVSDPVQYGTLPQNPATWDADLIYGCAPDLYGYWDVYHNLTSFTGSALDSKDCPIGYNKRLLDKEYTNGTGGLVQNYTHTREIQRLSCGARSGSFQLQFRGFVSGRMSYNVTESELYNALTAMPSVGQIEVVYYKSGVKVSNSSLPLCSVTGGRYAQVTFISEVGSVPLLTVYGSTLYGNTLSISRVQAASQVGLLECAGFGDCDRTTGVCNCWDYYGSSDGFGGVGTQGDCGHNLIF